MQQKRSKAVWWIAIAVAFFFFIDPFSLFDGRKVPTTRADNETRKELASFVDGAGSATDAVIDLLRTSDVVLIGESGYVSQHLGFAAELIPALDAAGILHFGYQYANTEDQQLIDELVTAPTFDEQLARQIIFNHLNVLGFQEYVDVLRAAWEVNREKGSSQAPFRVVALSNRLNYTAITNEEDIDSPAVMRRVFETGVPDVVIAETIASEFLEKQVKAVAYLQMDHAFTGLRRTEYEAEVAALGFAGVRRAGNELRSVYGERVVTAALHGPVRLERSQTGFGYLAGSIIDDAVSKAGAGQSVGFRVDGSPFATIPVYGDTLTTADGGAISLSDYADGYLAVVRLKDLTAVTPIEDFINEANLAEAIRSFPGVGPEGATVEDLNQFIAGNATASANVFKEFK